MGLRSRMSKMRRVKKEELKKSIIRKKKANMRLAVLVNLYYTNRTFFRS